MAPYVAAMATEQPLGPRVGSPVGNVKSVPEEGLVEEPNTWREETNTCNQEVGDCYEDVPSMDYRTIRDSLCREEPFCRICHEGGVDGELLSPCECAGTLAMVHRVCLEHWLTASNSSHCELCHHQFALERLPKPFTEWLCSPSMQHQRRTLCSDALCFLFITPLASLSGWLCVQGAMDLFHTNSMEAVGLLVLTLALFTIYVFWTVVSVRYHTHLFRTWKHTDQSVRLQIPRPARSTHKPRHLALSLSFLNKGTNKETMV